MAPAAVRPVPGGERPAPAPGVPGAGDARRVRGAGRRARRARRLVGRGRFAAEILPGIFRLDDPSRPAAAGAGGRRALEQVVAACPPRCSPPRTRWAGCISSGSKQKDEVNASERKIGGADLAPVTQLFTENYMVRFLLENSLGAWWAAPAPRHAAAAGAWSTSASTTTAHPAAGSFEGWPATVAEVTVMDPCCGSGHFLVAAFGMLWRMRAEEEGSRPAAAQDAVLRDNLFGLELDPRCTQIAMFAVALEAWKAGGGCRPLPVPNIACSGIPVKAPVDEWTELADGDKRLENGAGPAARPVPGRRHPRQPHRPGPGHRASRPGVGRLARHRAAAGEGAHRRGRQPTTPLLRSSVTPPPASPGPPTPQHRDTPSSPPTPPTSDGSSRPDLNFSTAHYPRAKPCDVFDVQRAGWRGIVGSVAPSSGWNSGIAPLTTAQPSSLFSGIGRSG